MSVAQPHAVIAEDEVILRLDTADLLRDLGFAVLEAENATDALRHIEAGPDVRLLYTDVHMPGCDRDGFDLGQEVAERWPAIGIIICSSCLPPRPEELPEKTHFLSKPCAEKRVRRILDSLHLAH